MGIEKSVHKWSCPLTRVSVSGELTVSPYARIRVGIWISVRV